MMNIFNSESQIQGSTVAGRVTATQSAQWSLNALRLFRRLNKSVVFAITIGIGLAWSIPTFGLFITSFRPAALIDRTGWWTALVPPWSFTIENYAQVLQAQGMSQAFINSLLISVPSTILPLLIGAFAAYAFAWIEFPGRDWLFFLIIALPIIPGQALLAPILEMFTATGITGSYLAVWLAHTAIGLPFTIYLLRNFFSSIPRDLIESAYIDGANHFHIFISIILPLSVPSLASLFIFQFMWVWNDLLIALIFLGGNPERAPMTVTIANLVNSFGTNYHVLTSAAFISMILPLIIFFSLQRFFIRGILAGSVKG